MNSLKTFALLLCAVLVVSVGCDRAAGSDKEGLSVVASTTMLEDLVRQLVGDEIEVHGLVGIGADPHVYQPRPADARTIAQSDAVVMNGLLLEGWMEDLIRNAGGERPVIVGGEVIDEDNLIRVEGAVDPHIWFDVGMWRQVAEHVAQGLVELAGDDEGLATRIKERHAEYDQVLADLDEWIHGQLRTIPDEQRVLITSHDAFNYFGQAYGIDVEGIQGISTEQEASQRDVITIIELVRERNAPAVFTESSVHPGLINQVARETGIETAGPLYSDSVGPADSGAHTYVGMVQANVEMITRALGGNYQAFDAQLVDESADEDDA